MPKLNLEVTERELLIIRGGLTALELLSGVTLTVQQFELLMSVTQMIKDDNANSVAVAAI